LLIASGWAYHSLPNGSTSLIKSTPRLSLRAIKTFSSRYRQSDKTAPLAFYTPFYTGEVFSAHLR